MSDDLGTPDPHELADHLREILAELAAATGSPAVRLTRDPDLNSGVPSRTVPLGAREHLVVELPTHSPHGSDLEQALDRAVRRLRALRRRHAVTTLPPLALGRPVGTPTERIRARILAFLEALASLPQVDGAHLVVRGQLIASVPAPTDLEAARWQFIARRVAASPAEGSSHGELADPDFYACTFWYGAVLILFAQPGYAVDFLRHRARQVARELAVLLPELEPEPPAPAAIAPR